MSLTCAEMIKRNLGLSRCKLPGLLKGMIELPKGTAITPANFLLLSYWNGLLTNPYATRAYFWPQFRKVDDLSEESVYEQTAISTMFVRNGKFAWRFGIRESLCLHTKLYTHNSEGGTSDVILIDIHNNFIGTEDADGNIRGFSIDLLNTENLKFSDGGVASQSPIYLCLQDNTELNEKGVMAKNQFFNQLKRIVDVTMTDIAHTLNDDRTVDVKSECDGTPIQGLLAADFIVYNAAGVSVGAVTTAVEDVNIPGRYLITKADAFVVGGSVKLRAVSLLTVSAYEQPTAMAITSVA